MFEMWAYYKGTEYHHTVECRSVEEGEAFVARMAKMPGWAVDQRALQILEQERAARAQAQSC